jgi:hypothetical protein
MPIGAFKSALLGASGGFSAIGGNSIVEYTDPGDSVAYKAHIFTSSGTFEIKSGEATIQYLVVAAGGNGGGHGSYNDCGATWGGGGAGGYRSSIATDSYSGANSSLESTIDLGKGTYTVTVGGGVGAGGTGGSNGGDSTFHTVTSLGGGGGARFGSQTGKVGGSGGGPKGGNSQHYNDRGAGTANQGFEGGTGQSCKGGGGGGAASSGSNANGGSGLSSYASGSSVTYAKGGKGAGSDENCQTESGNTGNGSAGCKGGAAVASADGIVIVRYAA